jgi:hypothetical protein
MGASHALALRMNALTVAAVAVALAAASTAFAESTPMGPAPLPTFGDTWIYRSVDSFTELETGRRAVTFLRRDVTSLVFRLTDLKTGLESTFQRSHALGRCEWRSGIETCADPYRFPIQIGQSHGFRDMPAGGRTQDLDCVAKAFEKVTVPAGTFDAFRIECEGRWTLKTSDYLFRGRLWNSHWYAPAVQQEVRVVWRSYRNNGGIDVYSRDELLEFRPAGDAASRPPIEGLVPKVAPAAQAAEFSVGATRFAGRFLLDPVSRSYSGDGKVTWANGDSYEGELVKGAREGRGVFVWADGQRYEGDWRDDQPSGRGRLDFVNGDRYEGEVARGMANGEGTFDYASGARHVGRFAEGVPEGRGRFRSADGQTIDGVWRAGRATGAAIIEFASGDRYEGEVEEDRPSGPGQLRYASGDTYVGRFAAGRPEGEGTYTWKAGDRYEGAWKAGLKHGVGRFTWANGDRFEGEFAHDERTERGTMVRRAP